MTAPIKSDSTLHQNMKRWRRDIHRHPETAYEEVRTSELVAEHLQQLGLEVHTGIGMTGVVGILKGKHAGDKHIALRADMDALPLQELNEFAHRSCHDGKMHACGHDGHTTMLLGAASHLAENPDFAGTLYFIFQPAEEGPGQEEKSGAYRMIADGLFTRFPIQQVYGMHNWPPMPAGQFGVHSGPVMAASDMFNIEISGKGGHAAIPETFTDPVLVAGHMITALHNIVSRDLSPVDAGLISISGVHAGEGASNVIPKYARMLGTMRALSEEQRARIKARMATVVEHTAAAFNTTATLRIDEGYPVTVNTEAEARICAEVATELVGEANVAWNPAPTMGSEDFAYMLQQKPGAYIWIGNGKGQGTHGLHNPNYDFNDDILPLGAGFWVGLAQKIMG